MTTEDAMSEMSDCCGDAAGFLLGALEPAEAERFRQHAEGCVACREELAALGHVVDALPSGVPQYRAPRGLRRRVMRAVRSDSAASAQTAWRRRRFPRLPWGRVPRPALLGALSAAVALAAFGAVELAGGGSSGARVIQASVSGVPAKAQLRISGGRAELVVSHLPPPAPGYVYELWIKRGNRAPAPANLLFSVTASGSADVGVPGSLHAVTAIMVTPEPAGGSLAPTHAPVIVARIA